MTRFLPPAATVVRDIADRLHAAALDHAPIPPIRDLLAPDDVAAAYAIQTINTERALADGRRLVGRKIGLTSIAVQKQLGVDQPDYGMLYADTARPEAVAIDLADLIQPKAEAEIAYVFGHDLDDERLTVADLMRAIDFAVPAVEIVDSRIANWDIRLTDTIADNASTGLWVLGSRPIRLSDFDPRTCRMTMEKAGTTVSSGTGADCMGSPLNATLWLARVMAAAGYPLRAGDTVLSGALGPMVPIASGDVFDVRIEGLGTVTAAFG